MIESSSGVSESMTYAGLTYYEVKGVEDLVTFTAAKRLNALLEVITYYYYITILTECVHVYLIVC